MKIYILPVHQTLQPSSTWFLFPPHNDDYGMEQDFLKFLHENNHLTTNKPQEADFHYLPVYWSRWILNHNWGLKDLDLLQLYVNQAILDDSKTFTVCHLSLGTKVHLGRTVIFWASRNTKTAIDIPLICKPHITPSRLPEKKYSVSFVGLLSNHPWRRVMATSLKDVADAYVFDGSKEVEFFIEKVLESYITLCPRGVGGSSFRFFEVMQLGGVPFLIGDLDTRPFKKYINWNDYSLFTNSPEQVVKIVQTCKNAELLAMGRECAKLWEECLTYGKWCSYVLKELSDLELRIR
jgi:hypothetical protein